MSSMQLIMKLSWLDPCHLCAVYLSNICARSSRLPCLYVCMLSSGHHVCLSVTKRHKAHLKRLDRRWTLGGVISRQQSRGELRQMLYHLPSSLPLLLFSSPHLTYCFLSHGSTRASPHAHICRVFSFCVVFQPMHLS